MDIHTREVITNSREDTGTVIVTVRKVATVMVVVTVMAKTTVMVMVVVATVMDTDILMVKRNLVAEGDIVMAPRVL